MSIADYLLKSLHSFAPETLESLPIDLAVDGSIYPLNLVELVFYPDRGNGAGQYRLVLRHKLDFDFYSVCAQHWHIRRFEAKTRLLLHQDLAYSNNPIAQTQPEILDFIPAEARAEVLAHYGIRLGES